MDPSTLSPKRSQRSLTAHYSANSFFEPNNATMLQGLSLASCNANAFSFSSRELTESIEDGAVNGHQVRYTVADTMFCNTCQAQFEDRIDQIEHYKCDWHRYNLHCKLRGLSGVCEEEFENIAGDVSSISGSGEEDSESDDRDFQQSHPQVNTPSPSPGSTELNEEDEEASICQRKRFHKIYFRNTDGQLLSVYRCLLHHKKEPITEHKTLITAVSQLPTKCKWTVLMISSGHFAGAVFNGNQVVDHKTFHRYTIRAKRGTAQSARDSQGNAPRGAGASLRRYNEAALVQDVQELLKNWTEYLKSSHLIFVRIPVANRAMFYGGKNPVLNKIDSRIRIIPFATRRPTFSETKRVQQMLSSVECYGQETDVGDFIPLSPQRMYNKEADTLEVRDSTSAPKQSKGKAKGKKVVTNEMKSSVVLSDVVTEEEEKESTSEGEAQLVESLEQIDFTDLREFDCSPKKKQNHKKKKHLNSQRPAANPTQFVNNKPEYEDEETLQLKNSLYTFCKVGDLPSLDNILKDHSSLVANQLDTDVACADLSSSQAASILNKPLDERGTTLLHVATKEGHPQIVTKLLEAGSDPSIKDAGGKTPYNYADSEVRNAYRRFMAAFPHRYDYSKAQVPSPLTAEMELEKKLKAAEKRKAKKKALQERNKEKKTVEVKLREETKEKERFLNLSDREKRALAAERRLLQQSSDSGTVKPVLSRCWQCGTDITGKVPFEYCDFKFCSTKCLREHRDSSAKKTS